MSEIRHGTGEELLALRDGEGSAWVREHAAACPACAAELERLEQVRAQLRALPSFAPPRDSWPVVREAVRRERARRRIWAGSSLVAAAAVVVLGSRCCGAPLRRPRRTWPCSRRWPSRRRWSSCSAPCTPIGGR